MNPIDQEIILPILKNFKTIAVIGLSPKPDRASHRVAAYMQQQGYRIIPIRPGSGKILGETCYASLADLPPDLKIDLVDVFRRAEETPPIAQEAVAVGGARVLAAKRHHQRSSPGHHQPSRTFIGTGSLPHGRTQTSGTSALEDEKPVPCLSLPRAC